MIFRFILYMAVIFTARAFAASVFEFGPVRVTAESNFRARVGDLKDVDQSLVPPADPEDPPESLLQPFDFLQFPENLRLPGGFISAAISADKKGGVGISGVALFREFGSAIATYEQSIFNTSPFRAASSFTYTIPGLEAALVGGNSPAGPSATVQAFLIAQVFDSQGAMVLEQEMFRYQLQVRTKFGGGFEVFRSPDLSNKGDGLPIIINNRDVIGIQYPEIKDFVRLPFVDPGGHMEILYTLLADGGTNTLETGYHALVGDPFNISGGFEITPADPAAVPEPATILLAPGALVGMLLASITTGMRMKRSEL